MSFSIRGLDLLSWIRPRSKSFASDFLSVASQVTWKRRFVAKFEYKQTIAICVITGYFKWCNSRPVPPGTQGWKVLYSLLNVSRAVVLLNPIISHPRKKERGSHNKCPLLCWEKNERAYIKEPIFTTKNHKTQNLGSANRCASCSECHPIPCQELLRGRPFSQMSEICFVSGILSLQEWESPFDLKLKVCIYCSKIESSEFSFKISKQNF